MAFQFIREECYAKVRSQGAPSGKKGAARNSRGKLAAREIIAEATRAPDATPHVLTPKPPICIHGIDASELPIWLTQIEDLSLEVKVKTSKGERRQRSDTPLLMGVVASYPEAADEDNPLYVVWKKRTLDFMKFRYGNRLVSVLEHTDESFGHLHAFVADAGRSVKPLHSGYKRALKSAASGESKKMQADAYKDGGRKLQDDFFQTVSIHTGLARIGPHKPRKTRAAWQADKQANKAMALATLQARQTIHETEQRVFEASQAAIVVNRDRKYVDALQGHLTKAKNMLKNDEKMLDRQAAENARFASENAKLAITLNMERSVLEKLNTVLDERSNTLIEAFKVLPSVIQDKLAKIFGMEPRNNPPTTKVEQKNRGFARPVMGTRKFPGPS